MLGSMLKPPEWATGFGMEGRWTTEPMARVLALFRLIFADPELVVECVECEPVYLILAMTSDQLVRMKPQNLLTGLPIKHLEAAT